MLESLEKADDIRNSGWRVAPYSRDKNCTIDLSLLAIVSKKVLEM